MSFRIGTIAAGMIAVAVSSLHAQPSFDDQPEHSRVSLIAETDEERRRQREAELRRANRLAERDQIRGGRGS